MNLVEKYKEIMEYAKQSKVDFYTLSGKKSMEIRDQKKPLEDIGLIVSNLMILEKLEEIINKLETPANEETPKRAGRPPAKK